MIIDCINWVLSAEAANLGKFMTGIAFAGICIQFILFTRGYRRWK